MDKAPGPNGFCAHFFTGAWPVIGDELRAAVSNFFHSFKLSKRVKATVINLVPKTSNAARMSEFRPNHVNK